LLPKIVTVVGYTPNFLEGRLQNGCDFGHYNLLKEISKNDIAIEGKK
jgi:hypothetical protein